MARSVCTTTARMDRCLGVWVQSLEVFAWRIRGLSRWGDYRYFIGVISTSTRNYFTHIDLLTTAPPPSKAQIVVLRVWLLMLFELRVSASRVRVHSQLLIKPSKP